MTDRIEVEEGSGRVIEVSRRYVTVLNDLGEVVIPTQPVRTGGISAFTPIVATIF